MQRILSTLFCSALVFSFTLLIPVPAEACGGFFCSTVPIDQTDEQIVFAADGETVTAHVQIGYTGAPEDFSWVIPVPGVPELSLGTDELFRQLLWSTTPSFELEMGEATCANPWVDGGWFEDDLDADSAGDPASEGGGVQVLSESVVGAYRATVVTADSAQPLLDWFNCNGYRIAFNAVPKVDEYLQGGMNFLALKLVNGAESGFLVPIAMTFESERPMVPLVLTAVAARANMGVRVWILADDRAVPVGYDHVWLNEARMQWPSYSWWWGFGDPSYTDLVTHAVDEAGGRAFLTDYAGPLDFMRDRIVWENRFDLDDLATYTRPSEFVQQALWAGLPRNAVMQGILRRHIPMPDEAVAQGVTEQQFYTPWGLEQWEPFLAPFDPVAATADIDELVVQPMVEAQALFDDPRFDTMTRLYTTLSPWEMDADPMFTFVDGGHQRSGVPTSFPHLGPVSTVHRAQVDFIGGDSSTSCWENGIGQVVQTSAGIGQVTVAPSAQYAPDFPQSLPSCQDLPAALVVETWDVDGTATVSADFRPLLDTLAPDGLCTWVAVPQAPTEPPAGWDADSELMPPETPAAEICEAFETATSGTGMEEDELGPGGFPQNVGPGSESFVGGAGCRSANGGVAAAGGLLFLPLMVLGMRRRNRLAGVSICGLAVLGFAACVTPAGFGDRIAAHELAAQDLDAASYAATLGDLGLHSAVWMPWAGSRIDSFDAAFATVRGDEPDAMERIDAAVAAGAVGVKLALGGGSDVFRSEQVRAIVADCAADRMPLVLEIDMKPAHRQMHLEELLRAYPDETFVLAHWGGLAGQLDRLEQLLLRFDNLMVDISLGAEPTPFLELVKRDVRAYEGFMTRRADRLIWGGGFTHGAGLDAAARLNVDYALYETDSVTWNEREYPGLSLPLAVLEQIYRGNAERVYLGM